MIDYVCNQFDFVMRAASRVVSSFLLNLYQYSSCFKVNFLALGSDSIALKLSAPIFTTFKNSYSLVPHWRISLQIEDFCK